MYPRIPMELVTDPLRFAAHTLGNTVLGYFILLVQRLKGKKLAQQTGIH